jgi:hypothetical protein
MITGRPIVGLCGYARSGKDTLAKALTSRGWERVAFADALKADLEKALGKPFAGMTAGEKEHWRPLMVEYGRARRAQHSQYWIIHAAAHIAAHLAPAHPVVITDVRYRNEAEWIHEQGGLVVRLLRGVPANEEEEDSIAALCRVIPRSCEISNLGTIDGGRRALLLAVRRHYGKVPKYARKR